jgi:hypothetical protein
MIGDSIIQKLQSSPIWNDLFEPLHCLNFGIGGDLTQGVLWRIQSGILDNIKPKVSDETFLNVNVYIFICVLYHLIYLSSICQTIH